MGFKRLGGTGDNGDMVALPGFEQLSVDVADRHGHRYDLLFSRQGTVIKDYHPDPFITHCADNFFTELLQGLRQFPAEAGAETGVPVTGLKARHFRIAKGEECLENIVREDRRDVFQASCTVFGFDQRITDTAETDRG